MTVFTTPAAKAEFQARYASNLAKRQAAMDALNAKQDTCSWISCDNQAYATWARKGYCYSCFQEIMDSKD